MDAFMTWITETTAGWADLYGSSSALETLIMFLHLGGMLAAGGMAFTLDRAVIRSGRGWPDRPDLARELHSSHGAIVLGLGVVFASGLALTLSDPAVFLGSWVFWAKMVAVGLLLANGWFLRAWGERLRNEPEDDAVFRGLRRAALRSATLWAVSLLGGIAITLYA